jgi:tRNA(fMet)-specific endonuclease VapC
MSLYDSNVAIDMLQAKKFDPGFVSVLTLMELLRGIESEKRQVVRKMLEEAFRVINIDDSIIQTYCEIYRSLKQRGELLPDADLIIAATAIAYDLEIKTSDIHFHRLEALGLKLKKM